MDVFASLYQQGQNVIMVTHEADIAAHARRVVTLRDGLIHSDVLQQAA
jgi:putative ABC transport system ATP-binding protein